MTGMHGSYMCEWDRRLIFLELEGLVGLEDLVSSLRSSPILTYSERYRVNGEDKSAVQMLDKLAKTVNRWASSNLLSEEKFRKAYAAVCSIVLRNAKV